jgi:histidinol-phosphatase (PHP family)
MNYLSCIHTHTQFCDGKSTMEEFCIAALERGYRSLGFSPHSPLPYESDWAMKQEDLAAYFGEIARLSALYRGDLEILCGLEWDAESKELPGGLSYVIGSVHSFSKNGIHFSADYAKDALSKVVKELYDGDFVALCADYFELLAEHAAKKHVDVVGHFDLPTKYNKDGEFVDEGDPRYLAKAFACADEILAARPGMIFEINTGVMARAGKKTPYPSREILAHLAKRGARFVLTGDCHQARYLSAGYEEALALVLQVCPDRLLMLTAGGFEKFPLV